MEFTRRSSGAPSFIASSSVAAVRVLPLDFGEEPVRQFRPHRAGRVRQIDGERVLHRIGVAAQCAWIERVESMLLRQRDQRGQPRRASGLRRLHHPAERRVAAQRMEDRLGDLPAVAHAEIVVLPEEPRHQHVGRSVETQDGRQRFRDAVDHQGRDLGTWAAAFRGPRRPGGPRRTAAISGAWLVGPRTARQRASAAWHGAARPRAGGGVRVLMATSSDSSLGPTPSSTTRSSVESHASFEHEFHGPRQQAMLLRRARAPRGVASSSSGCTGTAACAMMAPPSTSFETKCTVAPWTRTPAAKCLPMRAQPGKQRQQRRMDVHESALVAPHEAGRQHPHEAGEHDQSRRVPVDGARERLIERLTRSVARCGRRRATGCPPRAPPPVPAASDPVADHGRDLARPAARPSARRQPPSGSLRDWSLAPKSGPRCS